MTELSEAGARELRALIGRLVFVFAKTMPEHPHEYVVRTAENEADYVTLAQAILDHGLRERYVPEKPKRPYWNRYLYRDGWKYWLLTTSIRQSRILNRARVADDEPHAPDRPAR
jgi:hypothetical protein